MIKEAFATGSTISAAVEAAKAALSAPETADVKVEIVEQPKAKILGLFGGSPAKARAFYEIPDEKPKAPVSTPAPAPAEKKARSSAPAERKPKNNAPAEKKQRPAAKTETAKPAEAKVNEASVKEAVSYLVSIIKGMGVEKCEVSYTQEGSDIMIDLDCGDDYGVIIGRRGETLDAIQYLTRLAANRISKEYVRISINVGSYREKREKTLRELAAKNASKVLKYGRNVTFEPMNPYERRIIHTAVQEIEGVTSHSVGSDTDRRVVITLAEGVKPTNPGRPDYNDRDNRNRGGRGGNNRRGGHGGRNSGYRSDNAVSQTPQREPRTDEGAQKVSLYGKIN